MSSVSAGTPDDSKTLIVHFYNNGNNDIKVQPQTQDNRNLPDGTFI
ncbi:MAG: hypothetical protein LBV42_05690 [Methanobrevibacter sp.]|nr:hypothetical protein [Methanobrevibacter sp.]